MTRENILPVGFVLAGTLSLAAGTVTGANGVIWGVFTGLAAVLWGVALWRRWPLMATTALLLTTGLAVAGAGTGHHLLWMVSGLVMGLSAWVMLLAVVRIERASRVDNRPGLLRQTFTRLLIIDGLALALAAIGINLRLSLRFFPALSVGILLVFLLSRLFVSARPNPG